jgi:hypothetical protein
MLFLIDNQGVPSVGHIARIAARQVAAGARAAPVRAAVFNEPRPEPEKSTLRPCEPRRDRLLALGSRPPVPTVSPVAGEAPRGRCAV